MPTYANWDIQEMPLRSPFFHKQVNNFLAANGLRLEEVDLYLAVLNDRGEILAGGGFSKDIIKCIAVAPEARSEGLAAPLVSRLMAEASARGIHNLKVFTKPENQAIFESLGFKLLASAPKAILMEKGRGLAQYLDYLRSQRRSGRSGVIVMNANPFTLGHKYLIDKASEQVDNLFIIPVKEDCSYFPYEERLAMIQSSVIAGHNAPVIVLSGSDYVISAATFPTYFLKDLSDAAETQMMLDLDLYSRWIAPALDATVRFVGSEPTDPLTARYNQLIPGAVVIPRLETSHAVSASAVREALRLGHFAAASALCPRTSWPYLLAALAERALRLELETPLKPGLVCPGTSGAHKDMDEALMLKGLAAIRPYWSRMALAGSEEELRQLGIDAETAMLAATGGVNTHRGAIFALGLTLYAFLSGRQLADTQPLLSKGVHLAVHRLFGNSLADSSLRASRPEGVKGARQMAEDGYRPLFEDWLPYYRAVKGAASSDETSRQMLLLRIMSTLDDTCVIKRVGYERAQAVKQEAQALLQEMAGPAGHDVEKAGQGVMPGWTGHLREMCDRYAAEGISPGGAADMLALTIFIDSIL